MCDFFCFVKEQNKILLFYVLSWMTWLADFIFSLCYKKGQFLDFCCILSKVLKRSFFFSWCLSKEHVVFKIRSFFLFLPCAD